MLDVLERAKAFLRGRAGAYRRLFAPENRDGQDVLCDLAKFCRAHESTGNPDSHIAARLDGRREVWLRVQQHIQLSNDDLWRLYGGAQSTKGTTT